MGRSFSFDFPNMADFAIMRNLKDFLKYGTHSIKSGAASNEGCRGLIMSGNLIDKHARWKKPQPKQRCIKYSKDDLLSVSE